MASAPASNETAIAIAASVVIAFIGATIIMGNPFSAFAAAYRELPETAKTAALIVPPPHLG